jgi:hypothetical protein
MDGKRASLLNFSPNRLYGMLVRESITSHRAPRFNRNLMQHSQASTVGLWRERENVE